MWIYKENALVNPKDIFLSGQGRGLALKTEAQMTDVMQIQSPAIPPAVISLSEILSKEINAISGVNEELTGAAMDEKAGILSMLRQGAGLTTLQVLFDQLDRSQRMLGKIFIDIIQSNFTPGKIKKILQNEEPSEQFYNKNFGRYDAAVEDGLNTQTQRQMQFAQMLQLHEAGVPITTEDLLEAATIQNKKTIIENAIKQREAASQQQQQQSEMQMQLQMAQIELSKARAQADTGLFMERASRVEENRALAIEKIHQANRQDEAALLDRVKAIKELESMDIAHLQQLVSISQVLKGSETKTSESGVSKVYEPSPTQEAQNAAPQQQSNPFQSLAGLS